MEILGIFEFFFNYGFHWKSALDRKSTRLNSSHLCVEKKEKAPKAPQALNFYIYIFFNFFFNFFWPKNKLAQFRIFWEFLRLFFTMVSIGKVPFSAKCFFSSVGGMEKKLRKKNWTPDSKNFTFFMPKNYLFFNFGSPLLSGRRPNFFPGISLKILHRKKNQVWSPRPA